MSSFQDKKILVTGGHGFLGQHVVRKLLDRGLPEKNIFAPTSKELDLREKKNCEKAVAGTNLVIHLAGITGDTEFHRDNPATIFYDNLMMGVELMDAARRAGVEKFVTAGSATEYPEHAPLPFNEENLWLGFPEPIHAPYTVAKKMLLVEAQAYRKQYGFDAVHLLLTNMYGPGKEAAQGFVITNIIKRIIEAERNGDKEIEVWGTGSPTRDFLYVEDAAEGIIAAAEKYDKGEPVNLGSGWEVSIKELVGTITRIMNFKGKIHWNTDKPDGQARRMLDTTRAEKEFGFRPSTSLEDGLRLTIEWLKNQA